MLYAMLIVLLATVIYYLYLLNNKCSQIPLIILGILVLASGYIGMIICDSVSPLFLGVIINLILWKTYYDKEKSEKQEQEIAQLKEMLCKNDLTNESQNETNE